MELATLQVDITDIVSLRVTNGENHVVLRGCVGRSLPPAEEVNMKEIGEDTLEVAWRDIARLRISHIAHPDNAHQYNIAWTWCGPRKGMFHDIYDFGPAHWYGASQVKYPKWPIEKWRRKLDPYVCDDSYADKYGGVQERYWLSSSGTALFVEPDVPLFVSMNDNGDRCLGFVSKFDKPYKNVDNSCLTLNYSIFQAGNVKDVHSLVCSKLIPKPVDIPDDLVFRYPIWSTWAIFKKNINQDLVIKYADEILKHGFPLSQLEIDDDWTPAYGDMVFDNRKFPDPKKMINDLTKKAVRATVWVHPFASPKSKAFYQKKYWVGSMLGGMTTWWNGVGKYLDVTNPDARKWFMESLNNLREDTGLVSFKFDAGEVSWLPSRNNTFQPMMSPNTYSQLYAEMAYKLDQTIRCQEVRVGWKTQHLPVFVRMMDKDSTWGYDNGLKTLIPHALTFSIIGYPFILPDMIGGNAYREDLPERELYIRWLEVNTFLPALQFSIAPWQYDNQVIEITKKMLALRAKWADYILTTAHACVETGAPIIRPLWWMAPEDKVALETDSHFLVGDILLVAPILERGALARDIYLPAGQWHDELTDKDEEGDRWLKDYAVQLDQLPHFTLKPGEEEDKQQPATVT